MALYQTTDLSTLENTNMIVNIEYSNIGQFTASQYIGNLLVSGIPLNTQPGYIYNFSVQCSIQYTLFDQNGYTVSLPDNDISSLQLYTTANLTDTTDPYYIYSNNCEILSSPNFLPFSPFTVSAI
jgi:hypothetical protein